VTPSSEPTRSSPSGLDDCHFGQCELVVADFIQAIRHEPSTRRTIRWATYAGAVSIPLGCWSLTTKRTYLGGALLAFGAGCLATHNVPEHAGTRWFQRVPRDARSPRFTVNPQALIVVSDTSPRAYPWRELHGFLETPQALLVWVNHKSFLIVPKRAFNNRDLPRVIDRLGRELGEPPSAAGFWTWLLAGTAVLMALLWLWNWFDPR
jgi:hypothetical protein